ncbi:hypothetical protein KGR20_11695 [Cytobacillus oceanisediminis]|uniref:hypothetical protein n=1 Tax=Cytobacillus oceanisediminis TaxID=665099 RepID=UPI001CCF120D|nr:hypothetical protein [Cytobacillus oceanisediminis]MBZ9534905.1 hypothetical protein [Cytobacillus oceanisediminis]
MKSELKKIVQDASQEVAREHFNQDLIDKKVSSLISSNDEDYLNNVLSFTIETATGYSSSVLLAVLEKLEEKGYLKV